MAPEAQRGTVSIAVWIPILVLLYFLSIGPVAWLYRGQTTPPPPALMVFYAPLEWLWDHTPARGPIDAYIELWRPQHPIPPPPPPPPTVVP